MVKMKKKTNEVETALRELNALDTASNESTLWPLNHDLCSSICQALL
jgi:hypothetical protein